MYDSDLEAAVRNRRYMVESDLEAVLDCTDYIVHHGASKQARSDFSQDVVAVPKDMFAPADMFRG